MPYRMGIDVGGTFTDFLLLDADGHYWVHKTPSTPEDPSRGVLTGIREIAESLGLGDVRHLLQDVTMIVHGTTVATNAVLTRRGAKTALITTRGFRDILAMRRGVRPDPYDNTYRPPAPLVPRYLRVGVDERIDVTGTVIRPLDMEELEQVGRRLREEGIEAVAVALMHSYHNPEHECAVEAYLRGTSVDWFVSVSHQLCPTAGLYERTSTTVLNAYVGPIVASYLERLVQALQEAGFSGALLVMQSNGGVTSPAVVKQEPARTLLSGPASAPAAARWYLAGLPTEGAITLDMGGTSFDVGLVQGGNALVRTEGEVGDWPVRLPMVDIYTIGAGGGSIAWVDGGLLHVGPQSAGAQPGPACYGRGGEEPTVTDANLVLGYLNPLYFLGGRMRLDPALAERAIARKVAEPLGLSVPEAAAGILQIVNFNMANGIREITVKRGFDPREFPLICAGGAGPLQVGAIARELECGWVIVPRESSIFCAAGMLMSDLRHDYMTATHAVLSPAAWPRITEAFAALEEKGRAALAGDHLDASQALFHYRLEMRYEGQFFDVTVTLTREERDAGAEAVARRFHEEHERLFGYALPDTPVHVVNVHVSTVGPTLKPRREAAEPAPSQVVPAKERRQVFLYPERRWEAVSVWDAESLQPGCRLRGPALVDSVTTTVFVPSDFAAIWDLHGNIHLLHETYAPAAARDWVEQTLGRVVLP